MLLIWMLKDQKSKKTKENIQIQSDFAQRETENAT